jgi:8-oxo-dGTP pyrophosphatase MutT (NUDIX family)
MMSPAPPRDDDQEFRLLTEELHYEGYAFKVFNTQWEAPGGEVFERDLVRHIGAVAIVPVTAEGDLLLVSQFRTALGRRLLELPAGLRDVAGEADIDTARRELEEEVGHLAGHMEHLCTLATAVGFTDESISIYLATDLTATEVHADGIEEESMTIERVSFDEVDGLIASGELVDAKTVAGVLVARGRLGR